MKFYVIHHSHTDIGYTDRQEKIEWHHVKYIEDVIDILRKSEEKKDWKGFVWNVETFWMVDAFLKYGKPDYIEAFWQYVKDGRIGLSGNYLNCTDLMSDRVLDEKLAHAQQVAKEHGVSMTASMTSDINGYSWGYASALHKAGVKYLFSQVHTHHGYHVGGKKQYPFYWVGPDGNRILVWHGEHYNLGNELRLDQYTRQYSYMIRDGLPNTGLSDWDYSKERLFAYAKKLKEDGFPFDCCPIGVSGICTDNSPAGPRIIEFINRWNAECGDELPMEMATLDTFFAEVEKQSELIPTYSGDWTDWWADGTCSTPNQVKHYREAVRKYQICEDLDPECKIVDPKLMEVARDNLMLYAEHTWGFSSSIDEPCHPQVNTLDLRKNLYAGKAHEAVSYAVDALCEHFGETAVVLWKDYRIQVVNPTPQKITTLARTDLEILFTHKHFVLIDEKTGEEMPYQLTHVARGWEFNLLVTLDAYEKKSFAVKEIDPPALTSSGLYANYGADQVKDFAFDLYKDPDWICTPFEMVTPYFYIRYELGKGITSIYDRKHDCELMNAQDESAFQPIYEITPIVTDPHEERRRMGRNRKNMHTIRDFGRLVDVKVNECGEVLMQVTLTYEVKGSLSTELILTTYRGTAKLDVDYRLHKESRLEPENVYLALPFAQSNSTLYADKTGCILRPRIDQLPGACVDFYELQNAVAWVKEDHTVMVELPDAPMITMGEITPHLTRLMGDPLCKNTDPVYSWVMNNYWETNFKADLGGFHQYHYALRIVESTDVKECFSIASADNTELLCFTSFDVPFEETK